jgi:hypothetical protein
MPSNNYRAMVIAVGVVGILAGLALMLLPYGLAVEGQRWTRPCSAPIVGSFSGSDSFAVAGNVEGYEPVTEQRPAGVEQSGCPSSARVRLALGIFFVAGGLGTVSLIARKTRKPGLLANGPVPPSWEATGGPPPA